jgi:SAM-dependent methyltransferase
MDNLIAAAVPQALTLAEGLLSLQLEDRALLQLAKVLQELDYRFITVSPASHQRVNQRISNHWARNIVDVFGWSRPFREDLLPPTMLSLMRAAAVLEPVNDGWRSRVRFSTLPGVKCDELLVHSAYPTNATDAVFFGPDTYRFNNAIHHFLGNEPRSIRRALDLGCGSGAGAISIARERPDATVIASDINEAALRLARVNAVLAGAAGIAVQQSDLLDAITGDFDLIVANPPFLLDPEQRSYRHGGGERGEGLSLKMVQAALPRLLAGGTLLMYTGVAIVDGVDPLLARLAEILPALNVQWHYREIDPDIFGEELDAGVYVDADRIAAVVLTATSMGPTLVTL